MQETYDGGKLRSLIDMFVHELSTHVGSCNTSSPSQKKNNYKHLLPILQLIQEISYLEPRKIRASGLTEAEVHHIASVSEKHMKSMVKLHHILSMVT